jgi:hypothetical protein
MNIDQIKNILTGRYRRLLILGVICITVLTVFIVVGNIKENRRLEEVRLNNEASKLGFSSVTEMQKLQAMGFNKKIEYEESEAKKLGFDSSNEKNAINRKGFSTKQDYLEAQENAQKEGWYSFEEKKQAGGINDPKEYRAQLVREEREKARAEERAKQAEASARMEKDRELYCYVYNKARQDCATASNINQCIDIKLPSWAVSGKYIYSCY